MKTQISRNSAQPEKNYSGVYQQQGRMITDADWNALTDLEKQRLWDALRDAIDGGAPRTDGFGVVGPSSFRPGVLYVDGIPARLRGTGNVAFNAQPDYPSPPALPAPPYTLYADVWERTITSLEDDQLLDAGLHGADTCTRTQTMLQVKWCPAATDPEDPAQNPPWGNAGLKLKLRQVSASSDACDPCSDEVDAGGRVGNYLFRVEVHDVFTSGGNLMLDLKWSRENGAEAYATSNVPAAFKQGDWIFELFDTTSEKKLGVQLGGAAPARGELVDAYPVAPAKPFVRRWDGTCRINLTTGAVVSGQDKGVALSGTLDDEAHGYFAFAGGRFTANLDLLNLDLQLAGRTFVAGDFWQAAVREEIHVAGSVVLGASGNGATPAGVEHHYLRLGAVTGAGAGTLTPLDDAGRRRFNFPPLTDIHADEVGFTDHCNGIFNGAKNVQAALDAICQIGAEDINYALPACPSPNTVNSLLEALLGPSWPDLDGDGKTSAKDVLDALLCRLDAARLPYDGSSARWTDIKEGAAAPTTVQGAIDDLITSLDSQDIPHATACAAGTPTLRGLLWPAAPPANIGAVVNDVLCNVKATHIPLATSTCPTIAGAVTVQDALEELCKRRDGLSCEITVGEGGEIATLQEAFERFPAGGPDLVICLLPSQTPHRLTKSFTIAGKRTIKINGAGAATQIAVEAEVLSLAATEIFLRDLDVKFTRRAGQLTVSGGRVVIESCRLERQVDGALLDPGMLRLGGGPTDATTQFVVRNNVLATRWTGRIPLLSPKNMAPTEIVGVTLGNVMERLLTAEPETPQFETELDKAGQRIAALSLTKRKKWAAETPVEIKDNVFFQIVDDATLTPQRVKETLRDILRSITAYGRALEIASPRMSGELVGNQIAGHVVVFTEAGAGVDLGLPEVLTRVDATLFPPEGSPVEQAAASRLHVSGNRMVRFTYLIHRANRLAGTRLKAGIPAFRTLSLVDNEFFFDEEELSRGAFLVAVAGTVSVRGNIFPFQGPSASPRLLAHHILCAGNSGDQQIPVQFLAAICPKSIAELKVHNFLDFEQLHT